MSPSTKKTSVYIETGAKRVFAGALDWPGWCRSGRDEGAALQALLEYGPRYARALRGARLPFSAPQDLTAFKVVERLKGGATTDFGAPEAVPAGDVRPIRGAELERLESVLKAVWKSFDAAAKSAMGRTLKQGPRGGGRALAGVVEHLLGSDASYVSMLGWKVAASAGPKQALALTRKTVLQAIEATAGRGMPEPGPRGGKRWPVRYFIRRLAWHTLDHAWELEDRIA